MRPEEKKRVDEIRRDPAIQAEIKDKSDEEILAASRFLADGQGLEIYDSEEAYRAAQEKNREEIEEI